MSDLTREALIAAAAHAIVLRPVSAYNTSDPVEEFARDDVAAALPVVVRAVTDEVRKLHEPFVIFNDAAMTRGRRECVCGFDSYPCPTVRLCDDIDAKLGGAL